MLKRLRTLHQHFLFNALLVFVGMCLSDWLWTRTISNVAQGHVLASASWSTLYATISAGLTISFVKDYRLVIPYMLGAFIGTYLGV